MKNLLSKFTIFIMLILTLTTITACNVNNNTEDKGTTSNETVYIPPSPSASDFKVTTSSCKFKTNVHIFSPNDYDYTCNGKVQQKYYYGNRQIRVIFFMYKKNPNQFNNDIVLASKSKILTFEYTNQVIEFELTINTTTLWEGSDYYYKVTLQMP